MERAIPKMSEFVVIFGAVLAVFLANPVAAQKVHVVGDTIGWGIPQNGAAAYSTWASSNKFVVGDILSNYQHFSLLSLFLSLKKTMCGNFDLCL